MELLGTTKISTDWKITIIKNAAELLGLQQGDILAYYLNSNNGDCSIILKKAAKASSVSEVLDALTKIEKMYNIIQKPDKMDIIRLKESIETRLTIDTKLEKDDINLIINKYFKSRGWNLSGLF